MRYVAATLLCFVSFAVACSSEPPLEESAPLPAPTVAAPPEAKPATTCGDEPDLPARARRDEETRTLVVECDGPEKVVRVTPFTDGTARIRRGVDAKGSLIPVDVPDAITLRTGRLRTGEAIVCGEGIEIRVAPLSCTVQVPGMFEGERTNATGVERASPEGERFYGLGLHTRGKGGARGLDLRGSVVDLYNTDAYDAEAGGFRGDAPSLYESIPFYVAVNGAAAYGVFTDDTHRLKFDLAKTDPAFVRVETLTRPVDEWIFAGPRVRDVLRRYTRVTGRMPMPAAWSIGFHQSRWDAPCDGSPAPADKPFCSSTQILGVAQRLRDEGIPADGVFLDIQHMRGFRSFTFDPDRFADPAALATALAAKGFVVQTIVDPGIKIDDAWDIYQEGLKDNLFLSYEGEVWPGPARFPDFATEKTRTWWSGLVAKSAALGVRGMWIDMNEPSSFLTGTVPDETPAGGGTTTMAEVHNAYGHLEAKATFAGMLAARPDERPFVLSRAAFAGQQKWSAVWTGDAPSTFATLEGTLPQLLHLGLSGIAFAGSDVGGYSGRADATAELFGRWMALGAVSPFFRAHAEKEARRQEPWAFGDVTRDATRDLVRERYALFPYFYSAFEETTRTGAPILRPLFFDHDADAKTFDVADEAMLGDSILVAPILKAGAKTRDVYLPAGTTWYELRSGAPYEGGRTHTLATQDRALPTGALPMFARAGAIVPRIDPPASLGAVPSQDTLYLDVFPDAKASTFTLYEDDGTRAPKSARATFTLEPTATGARLRGEGAFVAKHTKIVVRVVSYDVVVELASAALPFSADLAFDRNAAPSADVSVPIRVRLPAGSPTSTAIHLASSHASWTHLPLVRSVDGTEATGTVTAPRGGFLFFKITRGTWPTVEKSTVCGEIEDRAAIGAARAVTVDVAAWADTCP